MRTPWYVDLSAHIDGWMPHGHCYQWDAFTLWGSLVGNLATFAAYVAIPFALLRFVRGNKVDGWPRAVGLLFSAFILACGIGHALDALTIFRPHYALLAGWRVATGAVSVATAVVLFYLNRHRMKVADFFAVALPSPSDRLRRVADLATQARAVVDHNNALTAVHRVLAEGQRGITILHVRGKDAESARYSYKTGPAGDIEAIGYDPDDPDSAGPKKLLHAMGGRAAWRKYRPLYEAALRGEEAPVLVDKWGPEGRQFVVQVLADKEGGAVVIGVDLPRMLEHAVRAKSIEWFHDGKRHA